MSCISWLSPVISQNIKVNIKSCHEYSFIVFKYVNSILQKEKYILGRIGLYMYDLGLREKLN